MLSTFTKSDGSLALEYSHIAAHIYRTTFIYIASICTGVTYWYIYSYIITLYIQYVKVVCSGKMTWAYIVA